jgi:hypothetical protein
MRARSPANFITFPDLITITVFGEPFFNGSTALVGPGRFFSLLIYSQWAGLLGRVISSSQGLFLNRGEHKHRINTYTQQTSMPWVGFEPMITASELAKTVHALDRSVTLTGLVSLDFVINLSQNKPIIAIITALHTWSGVEIQNRQVASGDSKTLDGD